MKSKTTLGFMKEQFGRAILPMLFIITILFSAACVKFPDYPEPPNNKTEIVLIQEIEFKVVKPGETITIPHIKNVNHWFLISDFAMEKVNRIQVDAARTGE